MRDILADTSFHDRRMNFDSAATGALRAVMKVTYTWLRESGSHAVWGKRWGTLNV